VKEVAMVMIFTSEQMLEVNSVNCWLEVSGFTYFTLCLLAFFWFNFSYKGFSFDFSKNSNENYYIDRNAKLLGYFFIIF